jgi:hypothetical protein
VIGYDRIACIIDNDFSSGYIPGMIHIFHRSILAIILLTLCFLFATYLAIPSDCCTQAQNNAIDLRDVTMGTSNGLNLCLTCILGAGAIYPRADHAYFHEVIFFRQVFSSLEKNQDIFFSLFHPPIFLS